MNRRLEAHKSRKSGSAAEPEAPLAAQRGASSRAAQAAARVAARYAKAPSYSEMLAEEARTAVRAAEAASQAALEAQAAAESVLASLEAASAVEHTWESRALQGGAGEQALEPAWKAPVEPARPAASHSSQTFERRAFGIRWDEDLPARPEEPAAARLSRGPGAGEIPVAGWWELDVLAQDGPDAVGGAEGMESVEPAQPIHAKLIEFPRELVATRKIRPRLAEGPYGAAGESNGQLSIFEVDPRSISTQPEAADAVNVAAAPAWQCAEWSGIQLGDQPTGQPLEETAPEAATAPAAAALQLAPAGLRTMAAVVDGALIMGSFLVAALVAAASVKELPTIKEIELGSAAALMVLGVLYQALFFTLAEATPGMKCAHISLCTFDDEKPTRAQLRSRLWALLLSLLPVGLGVAWAIFDEDHLSWHDRLSRTYQRRVVVADARDLGARQLPSWKNR
ncbi:MAG: RDD family protein [Terracidiphilus sp.]